MFIKPFKVKSNNQLKRTERKKLCDEILAVYSGLTEDQVQNLLPKKETINAMKIVTHSNKQVRLYCVAKIPMFFQMDSAPLLPTIYTLWHHPDLLYTFTTFSGVESKLAGGADLMLPGVALDQPVTLYSFGKLAKGTPVSVNTTENKAAIAVGVTSHSSEDMYMSGGRGKCVEILHVIGDTLCELAKPLNRPELGPTTANNSDVPVNVAEESAKEENVTIDQSLAADAIERLSIAENEIKDDVSIAEEHQEDKENQETDDVENVLPVEPEIGIDPVQEMDELIEHCFLKACKTIKATELPMLSSNFFKNHVMTECPPDKNVDVKKSKYKKLSVFLADMKAKGVINTHVVKGVESLLSIKYDHPLLKDFVMPDKVTNPKPVNANSVVVEYCYKVTADVLPVLSKFGHQKGDVMKRAEIRKCFTEYVKAENLQEGKTLHLNPQLAGIFKSKAHEESVTMEDGINKFIGRMTYMHEISVAGLKILHTGKLDPIDMRVCVRRHDKKVTLVSNLEVFGINPKEFSKECQSIGASASITEDPKKKTPTVLIQGNQILHVYKLLTEKYQIKKTYIKGLEFAPKKKN